MAGIYIHIPFCKQRCSYCDFYTRVAPRQITDTVNSIVKEVVERKSYLTENEINTIYFGGGTPSLLTPEQFQQIFDVLFSNFSIDINAEITFEANPDDLTPDFFESIEHLPFNRISMGVQSFDDNQLKSINRRHSGNEAITAFMNARKYGFQNISVDLIYGLPGQDFESWKLQLNKALSLEPEHLSVYGLTYEEGTPLYKQRELNKIQVVTDDDMIQMHLYSLETAKKAGYDTYEISNFAKPGFRSRHNSAYWKMNQYLGLGPSAHSFNGTSRSWNISSIKEYNQALNNGSNFFETEYLSEENKYNEYIMVSLRTSEGVNTSYLETKFGNEYLTQFMKVAQKYIDDKILLINGDNVCLSTNGILISNIIIEDFILLDE